MSLQPQALQYNKSPALTSQCVKQCKLPQRGRGNNINGQLEKGRQENQWTVQTIYLGTRVPGKDPEKLYKQGLIAQKLVLKFYVITNPRRQ